MHNETLPEPPACRALTVVPFADGGPAPDETAAPGARARPHAGFVTQLIACERRLPAYRERRRCEPADASARYGSPAAPVRPRLVDSI